VSVRWILGEKIQDVARRRQELWASKLPDPWRVFLLTSELKDLYTLKRRAEKGRVPPLATTDYQLWGGHPDEILTDHIGKPDPGGEGIRRSSRGFKKRSGNDLPPGAGKLAGLGTEADMQVSEWDPIRAGARQVSWGPPNLGYSMATPTRPGDHYIFTADEIVFRYHGSKGECRVTCGYCESRTKSRDIQVLLRWWRKHTCIGQ
jgi:hypothetical protein